MTREAGDRTFKQSAGRTAPEVAAECYHVGLDGATHITWQLAVMDVKDSSSVSRHLDAHATLGKRTLHPARANFADITASISLQSIVRCLPDVFAHGQLKDHGKQLVNVFMCIALCQEVDLTISALQAMR